MKKFKSILFVVCLLITTMLPTLNLNAQFASGTGTQTDPYIITNATHMEYLADMVESQPTGWSAGLYFRLDSNIINPAVTTWIGGAYGILGIGDDYFRGTFDGNNHTINCNIINTTDKPTGLFSAINNATITNLTVSGNIETSTVVSKSTGSIAGIAIGSVIEGCTNNATIYGTAGIGGIVGVISPGYDFTTIHNCTNYGEIMVAGLVGCNNTRMGGIVGAIINNQDVQPALWDVVVASITNCYNYGSLTPGYISYVCVGGIIGSLSGKNALSNLSSSGTIEISYGDIIYCGGIVGYFWKEFSTDIAPSIYGNIMNNLESSDYIFVEMGDAVTVGGIIGLFYSENDTLDLTDFTYYGNINVEAAVAHVGGIIGNNLGTDTISQSDVYTISQCTNTADINVEVYGNAYVGGIMGLSAPTKPSITSPSNNPSILHCVNYGNIDISAAELFVASAGIVGGNMWGSSFVVTECVNMGHIRNTSTNSPSHLGGIVGYIVGIGAVQKSANTGTIWVPTTSTGGVGGIIGTAIPDASSVYIMGSMYSLNQNSGFVHGGDNVGGIIGHVLGNSVVKNLNVGVVLGDTTGHLGGIIGYLETGYTWPTSIGDNIYDKQMCRFGGIDGVDSFSTNSISAVGRLTHTMTGNLLANELGASFTYNTTLPVYPSIVSPTTTVLPPVIVPLLRSPAYLYYDIYNSDIYDVQDSVKHHFNVHNNGVNWATATSKISINNTNGTATITATGWDTLEVSVNDMVREIPIYVANIIDSINIVLKMNDSTAGIVTGAGKYQSGTSIQICANPGTCYKFVEWRAGSTSGPIISTDSCYTYTPTKNDTLVAIFEENCWTLTTQISGNYGGTISGDGVYPDGDTVTITAVPESCFRFVRWIDSATGQTKSTNAIDTVIMSANRTLIAVFEGDCWTLTTQISGNYGGTTSGDGVYSDGDTATITAIPESCFRFVRWIDSATGQTKSTNAIDTVIMSANRTLIAVFEGDCWTLTTQVYGGDGGTTSGDGIYSDGDIATITANPDECFQFVKWIDSATGQTKSTNAIDTVIMHSNRTLIAVFETDTFDVTIKTKPSTIGTVTGQEGQYFCGETLSITAAVTDACWHFVHWYDSVARQVVSTSPNVTLEIWNDKKLIAVFVQDSFNLNVQKVPTDGGNVVGTGKFACGTTRNVTATPNPCYSFINWTDSYGTILSDELTISIDLTKDSTIKANFVQDSFMLSLYVQPVGTGNASIDGKYACGSIANIHASPETCYKFVNWLDSATGNVFSWKLNDTLTMNKNRALIAVFKKDSLNLRTRSNPPYASTTAGTGLYECGTNAQISTIKSNDCYTFVNWTDSATGEPYSTNTTDNVVMSTSRTLVANYVLKDTFNLTLSSYPIDITSVILDGASMYTSCDSIATIIANTLSDCVHFVKWTDQAGNTISTNSTTTIDLNSDSSLIAHFEQDSFLLELEVNNPDWGMVLNQASYEELYPCDYIEVIKAKAKAGYKFINWTYENGNVYSTDQTDIIYMSDNHKLIANFEKILIDTFNLILIPRPNIGGSVYTSGKYEKNEIVTITATSEPNWRFINWTDSATGMQVSDKPTYNLQITRNRTLYANFVDNTIAKYVVTLSSDPDDIGDIFGGELIGAGSYDANDWVNISAFAEHANFVEWTDVTGHTISTNPNYEFTIQSDTHFIAKFTIKNYSVTVMPNIMYGGNTTGNGWYTAGSQVTITATSYDDYMFKGWTPQSNTNDTLSKDEEYSFNIWNDTSFIGHFVTKEDIDETNDNLAFQIFPNPVKEYMEIYGKDFINDVKIYNLIGMLVFDDTYHSANIKIKMDLLNSGYYYLVINDKHKYKFIISK